MLALRTSFVAAAALVSACASRPLAPSFPASSPASPTAEPAAQADVTTALRGDPPLPGESTQGWPGLADAPAAEAEGHGAAHGGHAHEH